MATKTKSAAKSAAAAKTSGKVAGKTAAKTAKTAAKVAKPPVKAAVKAASGALAKKAAAPAKKPAPPAKRVSAPAAKAPAKSTPAKAAPVKPAVKSAAKPAAPGKSKSETTVMSKKSSATNAGESTAAVSAVSSAVNLPPPRPPVRQIQTVSDKDLASAHEYLLRRSAGRSSEAVIVDGKPLLTEEQLLAMSDDDYMNEQQLAFFRHQLHEMERELLNNAGETTEHLRETVIVPDPADRATIEEEHALELRTRDRERKLLKKIKSSLAQIEAGDYGYCEETGDPIGIPRLLARPTATLSLEAQQRREIKQKMFGD